jgi:hypothetical protein
VSAEVELAKKPRLASMLAESCSQSSRVIRRRRPVERLAERPEVGGDDQQDAGERKRNPRDYRSRSAHPEPRDLGGSKPDTRKQDQQKANLGKPDARVMADRRKHNAHHIPGLNGSSSPFPG